MHVKITYDDDMAIRFACIACNDHKGRRIMFPDGSAANFTNAHGMKDKGHIRKYNVWFSDKVLKIWQPPYKIEEKSSKKKKSKHFFPKQQMLNL